MAPQDTAQVQDWVGHIAIDSDGEKIGKVADIYMDEETRKPEWLALESGLFGKSVSFVPLKGASARGDEVVVAWGKAEVKDAPSCEPDGRLTQDEEARLYEHYGLTYSEQRSGTGLPEGGDPGKGRRGGAGKKERDDAMTRSEEELRVGTERQPVERVRLRKYVVTEHVQKTVPVQHEEVRIEREPITEENADVAMRGEDISEGEHEETLMAEEVVVEKKAVPKERVRLDKDTVTEERQVSEEVRKERIDVDREPKKR